MVKIIDKVKRPDLTYDDDHKWSVIKIRYEGKTLTGYFDCNSYDCAYFQTNERSKTWYRLSGAFVSCRDILDLDKLLYLLSCKEDCEFEMKSLERKTEKLDQQIYDVVYKSKSCLISNSPKKCK